MTDPRRYGQEEIAEIIGIAATPRDSPPRAPRPAPAEGVTLAELQEIGREVGVAPERVAEAAGALELRRGALPRRTSLGMPVAVGRTVELLRAPTDREWAMLVAELRDTFGAQGKDSSRGELRSWSNGNLRASVEPTETGYRLRMTTRKGDAAGLNGFGIAMLGVALLLTLLLVARGRLEEAALVPMLVGLLGAASVGGNALRLPGWAAEREAQMERVAARARALIRAAPEPAPLPPGG